MQPLDPKLARFQAPQAPPTVLFERHRGRLRGQAFEGDHSVPQLEVAFVFAGAGALKGRTASLPLRPKDLIINPAYEPYSVEDSSGAPLGLYTLRIPHRIVALAQLDLPSLPHGRFPMLGIGLEFISLHLRRMLFVQSERQFRSRMLNQASVNGPAQNGVAPSRTTQMDALAVELLRNLKRLALGRELPIGPQRLPASSPASGLERMQAYVEGLASSFFEETTIDAAAQSLVLSRRRFTQLFREITQTTWLAYLRQMRIAHARRLLANSRHTVGSVAFECGFEDISTFYRAFKREARTSPNRWRQQQATG